jgi:Tol biopolymer transport system component
MDCAISSNGEFIAFRSWEGVNPENRVFHNNNGTLTNLNIGTSVAIGSCAVSSTGQYVAFLNSSGTLLQIKIRSGSGNSSTFSTDMVLASQPASGGGTNSGLAFSPDDTYLAVSPANRVHQTIYKFNSGTSLYEQLASPFVGALPDNSVDGCAFSAQGDFLAIATSSKTFFYERSGDTFTSVANVTGGRRGGFHPSGNFYITGSGQIYRKVNATTWTAQGTAITAGNAAAFSPYIT